MADTLLLTSPEIAGPSVFALQQQLTSLGYAPGRLDGAYGEATAAAVRAFQQDAGLRVDGVVGPITRRALSDAVSSGQKPKAHLPSAAGVRALAVAVGEIGTKERPAGSNRTKYGRWFGVDGVRWCNIFVSYCFAEGAGVVLCAGSHGDGMGPRGCAYVPTTLAWLRSQGYWLGRTTPLPGDVVIYDFGAGPHHIGIVESNAGGGEFVAIEGNTGHGDDADGGAVMRRERYLTQVVGFGRITTVA
jgi:Putative peptidoglycan binding domain/CHAP domain